MRDQFFKYDWPAPNMVRDICSLFGVPQYVGNEAWYEEQCIRQNNAVAILHTLDLGKTNSLVELVTALMPLQEFRSAHLFITQPGLIGLWHLDGERPHSAINIPVFNCDAGGVEWTDKDISEDLTGVTSNFARYTASYDRTAPVTHYCRTDRPSLLRVNNWHRVTTVGVTTGHRVCLSLRFKNNPTFESMKDLIRNAT